MKRFFCLLMSLMCLCLSAAHATGVDAEDYTVAGKLVKQLWAGSGFSATVSVEIAAREGTQAMSTLKPIVMDLSYIYVRPTATETAEHRADVVLLDGESAVSAAHAQIKDGALAVQAGRHQPPTGTASGKRPRRVGRPPGTGMCWGSWARACWPRRHAGARLPCGAGRRAHTGRGRAGGCAGELSDPHGPVD